MLVGCHDMLPSHHTKGGGKLCRRPKCSRTSPVLTRTYCMPMFLYMCYFCNSVWPFWCLHCLKSQQLFSRHTLTPPPAVYLSAERPLRGRGEYLTVTGQRRASPPSPRPSGGSSSSVSPSAAEHLRRSPETTRARPVLFRFPPAVPSAYPPPVPSSLPTSGESGASSVYSWGYLETVTKHQSQPRSPASVGARSWTSFDSEFPPLSPLSVPSQLSSHSPPSPLSPRLRLPPSRVEGAARRPAPPLHPLLPTGATDAGSTLLTRRRRRHRSRLPPPGGSSTPKRSGQNDSSSHTMKSITFYRLRCLAS